MKDLWGLLQTLNICIMACIPNKMAFMSAHHWNGWFMNHGSKTLTKVHHQCPWCGNGNALKRGRIQLENMNLLLANIINTSPLIENLNGVGLGGSCRFRKGPWFTTVHVYALSPLLINNPSFLLLHLSVILNTFSSPHFSTVVVQSSYHHPSLLSFCSPSPLCQSFFFPCHFSVHFLLRVM